MGMELEQDDPIDLDQHDDDLPEEGEQPLAELEDGQEGEPQSESEDDSEIVVTIGDEKPPEEEHEKAPEWVRELRKSHKELQRKVKEYEAEKQRATVAPQAPVVGKKPTLEDHDYDAEAFEVALENWHEQKRAALEFEQKQKAAQEQAQKEWNERLARYGQAKQTSKIANYDELESAVQEQLSPTQQGIIINLVSDPVKMIAGLGGNKAQLDKFAKISDPAVFIYELGKLETQLKAQPRKAPPPERTVTGSGGVSGGAIGDQLSRLQAEAEKTGDYTKVFEYKKQKRQAK